MLVQDRPAPAASLGRGRLDRLTTNRRRTARRFVKFGIVGASGVPVTLLVNLLLHRLVSLPLPISTALAVEAAIFTNFLGNHLWTFSGTDRRVRVLPWIEDLAVVGRFATLLLRPTVRRFVKFNAVSLVGLVMTTLVTTFIAGHYEAELHAIAGIYGFLLANLVGIGIAMVWNFLANVVWTWA